MKKNLPAASWWVISISLVILLGYIDWLTGDELDFFVFYFLPVSLAAWYLGRGAAVSISVFAATVWFGADMLSGNTYSAHFYAVWNTMILFVSFFSIGWAVSKTRRSLDHERRMAEELRRSLAQVKVLEAFLPICCECKKIRNQDGRWQQMESYIGQHTGTQFSHGYCPECMQRVLAQAGLDKPE